MVCADNVHVCVCVCIYVCIYVCMVCADNVCVCMYICRGVETLSQLPDILIYFHHSCPAPHIHVLCIQLSFKLQDIF